jgi:hypothetical protein
LIVKASARSDNGATNSSIYLYPNNVNTNTSSKSLYATSTTTGSGSYSFIIARDIDGNGATSNTFGNTEFYISNYTSSNYKSISNDSVGETNASSGSILMGLSAGLWTNTSAITSIGLYTDGNFLQYSEFTLYGVYAGGTTTPSAPTIASATDLGGGTAQIAISSPSAIPYTVTSSPSGITATSMSPINISGLSPQTSYTFTAQAVAPFGVSAASSASSSISMYNGMTALATVSVGSGGASSISFSSIPSGYSHLQIRCLTKSTRAGSQDYLDMRVGGSSVDTGSNYSWHYLLGNGSAASAAGGATTNFALGATIPTTSGSGEFAATVIDILDYTSANKNKTIRALNGWDNNGSGNMELWSSQWINSSTAIGSINLYSDTGSNFVQYSQYALYGVK